MIDSQKGNKTYKFHFSFYFTDIFHVHDAAFIEIKVYENILCELIT